MIAGGLGGTTGDMLMHSLDTVKTRQQGDPHIPSKYTSLGSSYVTILRQEGVRRGLYSGWAPALLGSFPGTVLFFGTYEFSKRTLIDFGIQPHIAYLTSGTAPTNYTIERYLATANIVHRIPRRPYRIHRLRAIRGPQDQVTAPRSLQQPPFQLRLQLPRHSRRRKDDCARRRPFCSFLRLPGNLVPRSTLLSSTVHVLRAVPVMGPGMEGEQGLRHITGVPDRRSGRWSSRCHDLPPRRCEDAPADPGADPAEFSEYKGLRGSSYHTSNGGNEAEGNETQHFYLLALDAQASARSTQA